VLLKNARALLANSFMKLKDLMLLFESVIDHRQLHETERFDPAAREHESLDRRRCQMGQNNQTRRGAITEEDMHASTEDFTDHIRN
jgi:hypothetical protein